MPRRLLAINVVLACVAILCVALIVKQLATACMKIATDAMPKMIAVNVPVDAAIWSWKARGPVASATNSRRCNTWRIKAPMGPGLGSHVSWEERLDGRLGTDRIR